MQLPDPGGGGVVIDLTYTPATTTTTTTAAPTTTTTTTTTTTHLTHTHALPSVIDRAQHSLASIASYSQTEIHIRGAADALAGIVDETTRLAAALGLVRDLECLQTPAVAAHARRVLQLAALLAGSMAVMAAESRRAMPLPRAEPLHRGRGQQQQQQQQQQQAKHRRGAAVVGRTRGLEEEGAGAAGAGKGAGDNREWRHLQVMWGRLGDDIIKLGDAEAAQLGLPQTTTARVVQWRDSLRE
ncbi:hypothetical protein NEMBOFW57_001424 [Staphylotrichum longicolle]|uniref:Uncharacterized protein n=1 Tax=Staphylotrichum longicolle TaxID=669026 RepID=A0AAD4I2L0_9PEZI|nr:hypothetical protein NEMBOFW57_001424 [Staphylotrichum longicolle]